MEYNEARRVLEKLSMPIVGITVDWKNGILSTPQMERKIDKYIIFALAELRFDIEIIQ